MFASDLLQDEEEEEVRQINTFKQLEELELQKQTLRNIERKKFMIGPTTAKLGHEPITKIDGRDLSPINPSILLAD
jgi:hypothetical protein